MKIRTSIVVLAVAALASWVLPGARTPAVEVSHEFLMAPPQAMASIHVQPVQLAVLFQSVDR